MNIYSAISNIMAEIGPIAKEKTNTQQGFKYRGVDDVMNALQQYLIKNKVFIVPETLEHMREDRLSSKGNALIYSICKIKYTFYAEDGSNVIAVVVGEGMDSGDKATNKAMAVAFKYACFQVFCIPTEEMKDPDSETHELKPQNAPQGNKPVGNVQGKPEPQQSGKNDSGANDKATKKQIAEVFAAGKAKKEQIPEFDMFKFIDKMAEEGRITNKFPYADKEKIKVNWTQSDILTLIEDLQLPF